MCEINKQGYGAPAKRFPSKTGRSKMGIGRGRFVIAHMGGIVLTTAFIVGMTAIVALTIRWLLAGR